MTCYFRVPLKITLRKPNQTTTKSCFCRYLSSFKSCQERLANVIIKKISISCKSNSTSQMQQNYSVTVLVTAGTVFCFFFSFIVSSMILYFGFGWKTMLITQQRFSCCWTELYRAKDISTPCTTLPARGAEWAQGAGRGQKQDSWPQLAKGMFRTTRPCVEKKKL